MLIQHDIKLKNPCGPRFIFIISIIWMDMRSKIRYTTNYHTISKKNKKKKKKSLVRTNKAGTMVIHDKHVKELHLYIKQ